ncbi:MAG: hypothetical protein ACHBN1_15180 [Heteroscytonema crispum UTEX LB 1556]
MREGFSGYGVSALAKGIADINRIVLKAIIIAESEFFIIYSQLNKFKFGVILKKYAHHL